jgi:hypothetical protein
VGLDGFSAKFEVRKKGTCPPGHGLIERSQIFSSIVDCRKHLHAYRAAHIASDCEYALPDLINLYDDVAMCPGALAHLTAAFGEIPI